MDFHQGLRICLAQDDLNWLGYGEYLETAIVMAMPLKFLWFKSLSVLYRQNPYKMVRPQKE